MSEKIDAQMRGDCERSEELIAYLYGEATKEEAGLFRQHLEACAVCREELAMLGSVRTELGAWRAEALGTVPSLNFEEAFASAEPLLPAASTKRSARAALREFFSLSPVWLRAGAFAATLAVCALVALTLARGEVRWNADGLAIRTVAAERVIKERVEVPVPSGYTDEQVNAIVAQKVSEAKAQLTADLKKETKEQRPEQLVNVAARNPQLASNTNATRRKRGTRRASNPDDAQIADDTLPRLSDLLSGSY